MISKGIVPYHFGRRFPDDLVRKDGILDNFARPNPTIRSHLAKLKCRWYWQNLQDKMVEHLSVLQSQLGEAAKYPGASEDKLFEPEYRHKHQIPSSCSICADCQQRSEPVCKAALNSDCEQLQCDDNKLKSRNRLQQLGYETAHRPCVHFGLVASGSMVMKSGEDRDEIAARENIIAFEMEGAGVWDTFPSLIIEGVCDYADSHKSKGWQNYAAATAAACMKAFLEIWPTNSSNP